MSKKKKIRKSIKIIAVAFLITSWTLSSWPSFPFINFPPKVKKVGAVPTVVILTSTDTSPWDVPSDWNDTNTIEVIGGGAGGGGGGSGGSQAPGGAGGGGAYATISNLDLTPSGTANFQIGTDGGGGSAASNGTDGGDTWLDGSGTTCSGQSICAEGGDGGASDLNGGGGGAGGTDTNSIGTTKRSGGTGANAGASTGGGGGGAAGDTNVGGAGTGDTGGDGGGNGAASGGLKNNAGTNGAEWPPAGSGGGGGGGDKANGGAGGTDGAGGGGADNGKIGGTGTEGVIVITYEPILFPTLTQNSFEYWVDNNALTPVAIWGNPDIGEKKALNAVPPSNDPIDPGDEIRIRMQISVTTTQLDAATEGFILAYAEAKDCSVVSVWTDVGVAGGAGTWLFTSEANVVDNTTLTSNLITGSEVFGRYNRSDPTNTNPNAIPSGQELEWDWHVVYNSSNTAGAKTYCFRMEKDDSTALDGYNAGSYPRIDTRPATADQLRHGNFFTSGSERGFFWSN